MTQFLFSKSFLFLVTAQLSALITVGQKAISIGTKHQMRSTLLNEERDFWISLPASYNDSVYSLTNYPVCYFFDGNTHFKNLVANRDWLASGLYASMPEIILVGIIQKDRTNELTPTAMKTPEEWKRADFSTSGGYSMFMDFIEQELKPMIDSTYRTNGYEILMGHSFGGLATAYTFVHSPERYDTYVAIDPSIWWDDALLLKQLETDWNPTSHQNKTFFLAQAGDEGAGDEHHNAIQEFNQKLNHLNNQNSFSYHYTFYPDDDHGTVVVSAEYAALRSIFNGYQLAVKHVMKDPSLIDNHYKTVSKNLGYTLSPPEWLLDKMATICEQQELHLQAEELLYKATIYYPESKHAQERYKEFMTAKKLGE